MRSLCSFEHAGLSIEIDEDPAATSPRDSFDRLGHLVFWHPTVLLGDEPPLEVSATVGAVASERAAKLWLPIWVSDEETGIELRVGSIADPDAASADGLIYATGAEIKRRIKLFRLSRRALREADAILRREVDDYARWIRGELLQFAIHDLAGVLLERQGGFYPMSLAREEATRLAEHHASLLSRYAPERLDYRLPSPER